MPVVGGYEGMMESQKHDMGQLLSALGGAGKIQDMELHGDRARLLRAQAGLAEHELGNEEKFAAAMNEMGSVEGVPSTAPQSRAAPLFKAADIAFRAGAVKKAQEFLSKASTIEHQENQDRMGDQKLKFYQRKDAIDDLDRLGGFYGGVKSQEDLTRANEAYKAVYPDRPLPQWSMLPYSPQLLRGFQDSLLTAQQRLQREQKDEDQDLRTGEIEARRVTEERRARIAAGRETRLREKGTQDAKAGAGKVSTSLGKDLPTLAAREIANNIFDGEVPPEFKKEVEAAKYVIAARAKYLLETNRGLDMAAAVARATQESRESPNEWQDTEIERPGGMTDLWQGTKVKGKKFRPQTPRGEDGLSAETKQRLANLWGARKPVPLDRKFTEGQVYETPKGNLMYSGGKLYTQEEWARR